MARRLEFTKAVKVEMFRRAGGPADPHCENCGVSVKNKLFEYDHEIEEWEREDIERGLRSPLTAEDGKLLCIPCHDAKTGRKAGERAHGKRIVAKAAKADKSKGRGFQTRLKRRMDGSVIDRESGEILRGPRRF